MVHKHGQSAEIEMWRGVRLMPKPLNTSNDMSAATVERSVSGVVSLAYRYVEPHK